MEDIKIIASTHINNNIGHEDNEFGNKLAVLMAQKELGQISLATIIGAKQCQVSQWLSGKSKPGFDEIRALCKALDVSADELLRLEDNDAINVVASTQNGAATKAEFDRLAGLTAGVCYLKDTTETLYNEPEEKTERRLNQIIAGGHHSPFDHESFTMELVGIPKIVAMILNNEKMYTTSEKSARYRTMELPKDEQDLYDKWKEIFSSTISEKYAGTSPYFTSNRIEKLAQENARYMTSVFTPTTMEYTVTYRQFNVLHSMLCNEIEILSTLQDDFSQRLKESLIHLTQKMRKLPYFNEDLADTKGRHLSLFDRNYNRPVIKQYGDVYKIAYYGSFAELAQAQRHRTISYQIRLMPKSELYVPMFVPPIIKNDDHLVKEWFADAKTLESHFPQGKMVQIVESGSIENLILKAKERECTCAQLEIDRQTHNSIHEIRQELLKTNHPAAEELEKYDTPKARCTKGFKCTSPCGFSDGINGERMI